MLLQMSFELSLTAFIYLIKLKLHIILDYQKVIWILHFFHSENGKLFHLIRTYNKIWFAFENFNCIWLYQTLSISRWNLCWKWKSTYLSSNLQLDRLISLQALMLRFLVRGTNMERLGRLSNVSGGKLTRAFDICGE